MDKRSRSKEIDRILECLKVAANPLSCEELSADAHISDLPHLKNALSRLGEDRTVIVSKTIDSAGVIVEKYTVLKKDTGSAKSRAILNDQEVGLQLSLTDLEGVDDTGEPSSVQAETAESSHDQSDPTAAPGAVNRDDSERALEAISRKYELRNLAERRRLEKDATAGDAAAGEKLILHSYSRIITSAHRRSIHEFADLAQDTVLKLLDKLKELDKDHCISPGIYSTPKFKRMLWQYMLKHGSLIQFPERVHRNLRKTEKSTQRLSIELNRAPNETEISEDTELAEEQVRSVVSLQTFRTVSLDQPLESTDTEVRLQDTLACNESYLPELAAQASELRSFEISMLANLSKRERRVLLLHFGILGCEKMTLQKIGTTLGVSESRVHQIQQSAFRKLREKFGPLGRDFLQQVAVPERDRERAMEITGSELFDPSYQSANTAGDPLSKIGSKLYSMALRDLRNCHGFCKKDVFLQQVLDAVGLVPPVQLLQISESSSGPLQLRELANLAVQHLLSTGSIREAHGGDEFVLTEKGAVWLENNRIE
jgi:RNA polymerase sigma factor (sigma-70 family)